MTRAHTRGSIDVGKAIGYTVGIAVIALLIAFILPTAMGAFYTDASTTIIQEENTQYDITANLTATATNINETNQEVTLELSDGTTTQTNTITNGSSATYAFDNGDVNATIENVNVSNATIQYEYPQDFGWGAGASSLFGIIPLMILLVAFMFIVATMLTGYKTY